MGKIDASPSRDPRWDSTTVTFQLPTLVPSRLKHAPCRQVFSLLSQDIRVCVPLEEYSTSLAISDASARVSTPRLYRNFLQYPLDSNACTTLRTGRSHPSL